MKRSLILVAACTVGCGGGSVGTAPPDPDPDPVPDAREDDDRQMLARLNERARAGAVTETLHGVEVEDPYRGLEEESESTTAWIDAQSARSERLIREWSDPSAAERLRELLSIGVISQVSIGGSRVFYTKREGDREQPVLLVHDGNEARQLVDPLTHGERAALDWYYPSPRGRYIAFGISQSGDERSVLHVVDVESGELLEDRIERAKWSNVEWLESEDGFYYTRYPKPGEPDYDDENQESYFPRVFFHALGSDPDADPLVFGAEEGTDFPSVSVSNDDRWLVVNVFRGWSASDVYLFDRGRSARTRLAAPNESHPLVEVVKGRDSLTFGRVEDGDLYLTTNEGAPRYRIVKVAPNRASNVDGWTDLVAQGDATIEDWDFVGDDLVVNYIDDVKSQVRLFDRRGRAKGEIELPTLGSVEGVHGARDGSRVVFAFSGYTHAPSLLSYDVSEEEVSQIDQVETGIDLSRFTVDRVRVASEDGTEIPVSIIRGQNMERNGEQPVLLYGYGGFNVSLLPSFTRNALYWIERGGVYAVANLRGGGEFGEEWHRAGNLENKEHVFEDFEAVIRWFSTSGISRPERIAITGGSNGGLLMGAMITRCPDAFGATASYVGLYDMVRYHEFPPAELWISEYGSSENPEQFRWLHGYSPYHNVEAGTEYPSILIETADHDTRVSWVHSTKFAARLQEAQAGDDPILFYMVRSVGHGAGTRLTDLVDRYVRQYAFLEHELGMR